MHSQLSEEFLKKIPGGTLKKKKYVGFLGTNLGGTSAKIPLGANGKKYNRSSVTYQGGIYSRNLGIIFRCWKNYQRYFTGTSKKNLRMKLFGRNLCSISERIPVGFLGKL